MLEHVSFLSVSSSSVFTRVRPDSFVHANMINNAPAPSEFFTTVTILTDEDSSFASLPVLFLFYFSVVLFKQLHIDFTLSKIREPLS